MISLSLKANSLGQLPQNIQAQRSSFDNLSLFFDYRVKVQGIEWSNLDTIDSESENDSGSDASYV